MYIFLTNESIIGRYGVKNKGKTGFSRRKYSRIL